MANKVKPIPQAAQIPKAGGPTPVQQPRAVQHKPTQQPKQAKPKKVAPQRMREEYEEAPKKKGSATKLILIILIAVALMAGGLYAYKVLFADKANSSNIIPTNNAVTADGSVMAAFDYEPYYDYNTSTLSLELVNLYEVGSNITVVGEIADMNGTVLYTSDRLQPEQMIPNISIAFPNSAFPKQAILTLTAYNADGSILSTQINQISINS